MAVQTVINPKASTVAQSIASKAMLVDLTISKWSAAKIDPKAGREVAVNHGSDAAWGDYRKQTIAKTALAKVNEIAGRMYVTHRRLTLPWLDGGVRILSAEGYLTYKPTMRALIEEFEAAVDEFVQNYPSYRAEARVKLNTLFNALDYPSDDKIARKFSAGWQITPMPDPEDFRVKMSANEVSRIKAEIQAAQDEALELAMADCYARIKDVVGSMVERLHAYKIDVVETVKTAPGKRPVVVKQEKVTGIFRNTLVDNVRSLVEILPALNLTGSPVLAEFTARMRDELLTYDAETLRESLAARQQIASAGESILDQVNRISAGMSDFV